MFKVQIVFESPTTKKQVCLDWIVHDNPAALLWFKLLSRMIQKNLVFYPRFSGFISPHKTMSDIQKKLNHCIDVINVESKYKIYETAPNHFDQDFSNRMHHHFEVLRGSVENESDHFIHTSMFGRRAILNLNHLVHDMESLHRSLVAQKSGHSSACGITTEVLKIDRFKIPDEFFPYFTLDVNFGDMVLHYCQIGKTWWEVFLDQDEAIGDGAILPHYLMTGEFDIAFLSAKINPKTKKAFYDFLKNKNLDLTDPKLALGYLPVARLVRDKNRSDQDYLDLIAKHLSIPELRLFQNENLIGVFSSNSDFYDLTREFEGSP